MVSSEGSTGFGSEGHQSSNSGSYFMKYFKRKKHGLLSGSDKTGEDLEVGIGRYPYLSEKECNFRVGVAEDKNKKCRRTMEDAHTVIYNFDHCPDTGYFAVFDGHAGHETADWCSKKMHELVEIWMGKCQDKQLETGKSFSVCHALNSAFTEADVQISKHGLRNSGCTAAVAVLRWETFDSDGLPSPVKSTSSETSSLPSPSNVSISSTSHRRRALYVANVGDTRVILCRGGQALRLTYDHKGSDLHESKRVINQGGIMMNNRVSGVLAVTRSLGDSYMKDLVLGSPYTTETEICPEDEFIIVACDGLWDVCDDSTAVKLIRDEKDPIKASQILVSHALDNFSSDNLTCMVIRLGS